MYTIGFFPDHGAHVSLQSNKTASEKGASDMGLDGLNQFQTYLQTAASMSMLKELDELRGRTSPETQRRVKLLTSSPVPTHLTYSIYWTGRMFINPNFFTLLRLGNCKMEEAQQKLT